MPSLRFDEALHGYFLEEGGGETRLPSVSTILQHEMIYDYHRFGKKTKNVAKMSLGTHVHKLTHLSDQGVITPADLEDESERGYLTSYINFCRDIGFQPIMAETPMYHPTFLYAGTPDRYGTAKSVPMLIDIKTGQPHPGNTIQLAAYREMLKAQGREVSKALCVYLRPDGYTVHDEEEKNPHAYNWSIFVSALNLYRWKEEKKRVQRIEPTDEGFDLTW